MIIVAVVWIMLCAFVLVMHKRNILVHRAIKRKLNECYITGERLIAQDLDWKLAYKQLDNPSNSYSKLMWNFKKWTYAQFFPE